MLKQPNRKAHKLALADPHPCENYVASSMNINGPNGEPYCYNCQWAKSRHKEEPVRA